MNDEFFPQQLFDCLNSSKIELTGLENFEDNFSISGSSLLIKIYGEDSKEDQIKSILQGVVRFHSKFVPYTGGLLEGSLDRNEKFESEIEEYAQRVYDSRPDIVDIVERRLSMA